MYTGRRSAYQENGVLSAPQERLVPLLYEGLLKNLARARKQVDASDIEGKSDSLQKASAIVYELLGSLDFDAGGELASRLAGLYGFFAREIADIGRTLDRARLDGLIAMVEGLHEAWDQAARQVLSERGKA